MSHTLLLLTPCQLSGAAGSTVKQTMATDCRQLTQWWDCTQQPPDTHPAPDFRGLSHSTFPTLPITGV